MRDKVFITIGFVSLIGVGPELFGIISESLWMLFFWNSYIFLSRS
jgi:hypothetical protein